MPDADPILLEFLAILERLSIRHAVGGSVASGVHGEPRSTHDSDVLAELRREHVRPLVLALRPAFYVVEEDLKEALDRGTSFNVIHLASARKIDVFVAGSGLLDREQLARSLLLPLVPGHPPIHVTSAEVIVLRKLDWFRRGGEESQRQWRDVVSVLRIQRGRLDEDYLRRMAEELDLSGLLERAFGELRRD